MQILVACEESQAVTIALRKLGHEAYSCDLIPCSGGHPESCPNRFQQMQVSHPKQYDYCMRPVDQGGLGMAKVLDYIGVDH